MAFKLLYKKLALGIIGLSSFGASSVKAQDWIKVESDNFIFYSNVSEKLTVPYVNKIEKFNFMMNALYSDMGAGRKHEKFKIYFVRSHSDLEKIHPKIDKDILGFVRPCSESLAGFSSFFGDKVKDSKNLMYSEDNKSMAIMFHEYTHVFMATNVGMHYPAWFVEGFAEYYGSMRINDKFAMVGMPLLGRYYALTQGKLVSYKDIISENSKVAQSNDNLSAFYAQSWLLTHFFMSTPELKQKLQLFLDARDQGEDKLKAFERIFGMDMKALEKRLKVYTDKEMKVNNFEIKKEIVVNYKSSQLPKSSAKLLLLDAATSACPAPDYREKLLGDIRNYAKEFESDDYAQNILYKAEIILGDEEKSLSYYQNRTIKDPNDGEAWFRYGQALYLMAAHHKFKDSTETNEKIKLARSAFFKAYAINPINANNLSYISRTAQNANNPDQASVNAAIEAYNLAPSVDEFGFGAAIMLIRMGDYEGAKLHLINLISNPHNSGSIDYLRNIIDAIDKKAPKEEILRIFKMPPKVQN